MTTLSTEPKVVASTPTTGFQRRLGPFDATMLVAGSMIGSGIFIVSADIARDVGSAGGLLAVWLVTGLITVFGALSYAELAAMMPRAGGQYVYLREAYSPLWGFLYGWTLFLVIQTGTIAAVGVAFAKFLGVLVPKLGTGEQAILFRMPFHAHLELPLPWLAKPLVVLNRSEFTVSGGQLIGAALVILLTLVNCRGVQEGKIVQNIFTVTKTLALAVVIILGLTMAANTAAIDANIRAFWNTPPSPKQVYTEFLTGAGPMLGWLMVACGAMVGSLFSSDAWNNVTFAAGEVKNPRRTLPISLICGTGLVTVLYLLANVSYLSALPVNANQGDVGYIGTRLRADLAISGEVEAESHLLTAKANAVDARAAAVRFSDHDPGVGELLAQGARELRDEAAAKGKEADAKRQEALDQADAEYVKKEPARPDIAHAPEDRVGTALIQLAFPQYGAGIMAVAIMVSTFGCLNGLILAGARLYWAMARDGLFFRPAGNLNARGVPAAGLLMQAAWSVLLIFSGTYTQLLDYVIFAALLFYVLTVGGLFVLRATRPDAERPYRALGYPVIPLTYVTLCALIMIDLLVVRPEFTWPGLVIVLTGVPVYLIWRLVGRPVPASSVEA
jgi:amino acid transporter